MNTNLTNATPVLSAEELYDAIMREIEPDLTTDQIQFIESNYPDETEDDRTMRLQQYALAFVIFDEMLEEYQTEQKDEIKKIKNEMQKIAEEEAKKEDDGILDSLEKSINDSATPSA